ncbi:ankyrin repeat domain-containing protein [Wolbachia endosymbiont (group A) of Nomada ferruginata]|uniref:ankyrin repeat domain-containing protein n=1 Tax=Wolbachia endosymbiont (group A) of Nomada ferruginata TaxID=3066204 RepID=UPI001428AB36
MHHAAKEGNIDRAKRLLANGKDVNAKNSHRESPLSVAIKAGNLEVIELLVNNDAVITEKAIQYARGVYEKCEEDKKQAHLSVLTFPVNIHNEQLFKKAIEQGDLKKIESYVKKGAVITEEIVQYAKDVCKNYKEDRKQAHSSVLKFLEKTSKDQFKKAIEAGNLEVIELLESKDAVITEKAIQYARGVYEKCEEDKKQAHSSVLMFLVNIHIRAAIKQGNLERIKSLVKEDTVISGEIIQCAQNACKNCKKDKKQAHSSVLTFLVDIYNEQLLKKAIEQGDLKKIESYVKKGAVITEETIQYAREVCKDYEEGRKQAHSNVLTFLEKTSKDQFEKAIELGELERVELFVKKGAVITEGIIQHAQNAYGKCKERRVYIAKYPGGMKAEEQNRAKILNFFKDNVQSNSNLVNGTAASSQVVNEEDNNQSENPGLESAGSKQPQENVDKGENIMDNEKASIEEAIGNNYRRGEMSKNKKSIKQKSFSVDDNVIYDVERMNDFLKSNNNKLVLSRVLSQVNVKLQEKGNTDGLASTKKKKKDTQKGKLLKVRELLTEKISNIEMNAKAAVSSVTDVSATTSSHEAPVNIDDEKKQAHAQPAEHVPEESAKLKAQPSNTQEQQEVSETPVPEQTDDIESLSTQDALVPQSKSATVLSIDGEDKQTPVQPVESESKGDQQGSPPLSPQSSASGDVEGTEASANAAVTTPEEARSLVSDGEHDKIVSKEHQDDALEKDLIDFSSDDGNSPLGDPVPTSTNEIPGQEDGTQTTTRQQEPNPIPTPTPVPTPNLTPTPNPIPTPTPAPTPGLTPDLTQDPILTPTLVPTPNLTPTPNPVPTPEPVPSVANNKSEQVNDTQTNGGLPNNSGKNNAIPQNTKSSKLPVIAASALAIAGIISGVAVAVYLEMLAVGIAVGAGCLIVAIVTYCYRPKTLIENDKVEKVDDMQKSTPCCS